MEHIIQLLKIVLSAFNWSKIQSNLKKNPSNRVIFKSVITVVSKLKYQNKCVTHFLRIFITSSQLCCPNLLEDNKMTFP